MSEMLPVSWWWWYSGRSQQGGEVLLGVSEVSVSSCATTVCEPCPGWLSAGAAFPHALVAVPCVPTVWWRETWDTWCCPANQVGISMCALAAPWSCDEIQMVSRLCCRDEGESLYFWCNSTPQQRASMNRLPVLLCSVQYWVWDLADQGSQDTPEEFAPLASPGCAIFKCIVGSCFLAAALSGRAMQVSALERGVVPSASKWV